MTRTLLWLIAAVFLFGNASISAQYKGAEAVDAKVAAGFDAITEKECKRWLKKLASKEFEGRGTGQRGYQRAANYVAAEFKKMGLAPLGEKGSYFQYVPFARITTEPKKCFLEIKGKKTLKLRAKDGVSFSFGAGDATGPIVVLRAMGKEAVIKDPSVLKDKIVILVLSQTLRSQVGKQLRESGAKGLITVDRRSRRPAARPVTNLVVTSKLRFNIQLAESEAKRILKAAGLDPQLAERAQKPGVEIVPSQATARIVLSGDRKDILVPNVIGKLEGSDPKLAHETVILGSHLDHLGKNKKTIYYGADDDGSGSTALLATARAFSNNTQRPRRSVVFLAVCGEEIGLLGSEYYVEHPIIPIKDTVCELQMDMVGRNEERADRGEKASDNVDTIHLVGSKRISTELHEIILEQNRHLKFRFEYDEEGVYTRSDHYNFAKKGIPIAFIFSGFHPDYHKPTDTWDKINFTKIVATARLFYLTAFHVADREKRLVIDQPVGGGDDGR